MSGKGRVACVSLSLLFLSSLLYAERVEIPEGTPVRVRLKAALLSSQVDEGSRVDFVVAGPVIIHGVVAIPAGSVAWGAVQSVKKDKIIKFHIQGARLPNLTQIKLRSIREKSKRDAKDELKVDSKLRDEVGAPEGSEFTAYVDGTVSVEGAAAPPAPAPPAATAPAPRPAIAPAPAVTGEPVTLECFSEPSGSDILLDGDFRGTTPSILKIPPGKHHLEYQLSGYKPYSEELNLEPGTGLRTIRKSLEKKE